jgi:hypothetical protein
MHVGQEGDFKPAGRFLVPAGIFYLQKVLSVAALRLTRPAESAYPVGLSLPGFLG